MIMEILDDMITNPVEYYLCLSDRDKIKIIYLIRVLLSV